MTRPAAPDLTRRETWPNTESETPETDALTMDGAKCKPGMAYVFAQDARSIERRLSLAQTEIKGYMRVVEELKRDLEKGFMEGAYARLKSLQAAEYELAGAQSRIAELEKELAELHREWEADILAATDLRQDAARYRWLCKYDGTELYCDWVSRRLNDQLGRDALDAAIDSALKDRA